MASGYPEKAQNNDLNKDVSAKNFPVKKSFETGICFLTTLLYSDEKVKKVFTLPPIVSYRSAKKVTDYTIRSKLCPAESRVSYQGCRLLCAKFVKTEVTDTFACFTTKTLLRSTIALIPMITCGDKL